MILLSKISDGSLVKSSSSPADSHLKFLIEMYLKNSEENSKFPKKITMSPFNLEDNTIEEKNITELPSYELTRDYNPIVPCIKLPKLRPKKYQSSNIITTPLYCVYLS